MYNEILLSGILSSQYRLGRQYRGDHRSEVFRAIRLKDSLPCVVKVVRKRFLGLADELALRIEFRRLISLTHPNLVRVLDFGEDRKVVWLVSEQIDGVPVDRVDPAPSGETLRGWAQLLLDVFAYLHDRGVIHHDIKPSNVLIGETLKLIDLGLSLERYVRRAEELPRGTLRYLAPELFSAGSIDHRIDLYAAGVMLGELARSPTPAFAAWLERMTERNPERRFPDARSSRAALLDRGGAEAELDPYLVASLPWAPARTLWGRLQSEFRNPDARVFLCGGSAHDRNSFAESLRLSSLAGGTRLTVVRPEEPPEGTVAGPVLLCAAGPKEKPRTGNWKTFRLEPITVQELERILAALHPELSLERPLLEKFCKRTRGEASIIRQILLRLLRSRPTVESFRRRLLESLVSHASPGGSLAAPPTTDPAFRVLLAADEPLPACWFAEPEAAVSEWAGNGWVRFLEERGESFVALLSAWKPAPLGTAESNWLRARIEALPSRTVRSIECATRLALAAGLSDIAARTGGRLVRQLLRLRRIEQALIWVEKLRVKTGDPGRLRWEQARVRLLLETGRIEEAKTRLGRMRDTPSRRRLCRRLAFLEGRYADCPGNPEALVLLGRIAEGRARIAEKLRRLDFSPRQKAELTRMAGFAALSQGETDTAIGHLTEARGLWRRLKDPRGFAASLNQLGMAVAKKGDRRGAMRCYRHAADVSARVGDRRQSTSYRFNLAAAQVDLGLLRDAVRNFESCRTTFRQLGLKREEARTSQNLANIFFWAGHPDRADRLLREIDLWVKREGTADLEIYQEILKADVAQSRGETDTFLSLVDGLRLRADPPARFETSIMTLAAEAAMARGHTGEVTERIERAGRDALHRTLLKTEWEWSRHEISAGEVEKRYRGAAPAFPDPNDGFFGPTHRLRFLGLVSRSAGALPRDLASEYDQLRVRMEQALPPELFGSFESRITRWFGKLPKRPGPAARRHLSTGSKASFSDAGRSALSMFLDLSRRLAGGESAESLVRNVLEEMIGHSGLPRGGILFREGETLVPYLFSGLDWTRKRDIPVELSRSVAERVIARGEPVFLPDAREAAGRSSFGASLHRHRLRGIISLPLRAAGETFGAIYLDDPDRAISLPEARLNLLQGLTDHAATALRLARLLEDLHRENRRVKTLNAELKRTNAEQKRAILRLEKLRRPRGTSRWEEFGIVGRSAPLRRALKVAEKIADSDVPVLLVGESGTGKKTLAQAIARIGARKDRPFLMIDCVTVPPPLFEAELFGYEPGAFTGADRPHEGLLRAAGEGSLLFEGIAALSPDLQVKLLRAIQNRKVRPLGSNDELPFQARVFASVDRDPEQLVREGTLREDLYYRLAVVQIRLPPLRKRKEDLPYLLRHRLAAMVRDKGGPPRLSPAAFKRLENYSWPGNLPELFSELERAAIFASDGVIDTEHLSDAVRLALDATYSSGREGRRRISRPSPRTSRQLLAELSRFRADGATRSLFHRKMEEYKRRIERELLIEALDETGQDNLAAARRLGIPVTTFYRKLKVHRVETSRKGRPQRAGSKLRREPLRDEEKILRGGNEDSAAGTKNRESAAKLSQTDIAGKKMPDP